jgi:hypothetical protein
MEKFLCFIDDADDAACYPLSRLLSMTCASDGVLLIKFQSSLIALDSAPDIVTVAITADSEKAVMAGIVAKINAHPNGDPFVVICDDVNSVFAHADITSCTIALDT